MTKMPRRLIVDFLILLVFIAMLGLAGHVERARGDAAARVGVGRSVEGAAR